jgi:hypothetical protein
LQPLIFLELTLSTAFLEVINCPREELYSFLSLGHIIVLSPISFAAWVHLLGGWVTWGKWRINPTSSNGSIVVENDVVLEANYTSEYEELFKTLTEIVEAKIMNETRKTQNDISKCQGRPT